ncbi:PucR family transcriptional regulator ligand-binding domain-containing protein [Mumia sp. DW29H23]|uniref:PucR family transcriptional regulator n=1 Tax=Mumia sp. DW29H23 TaxID=3421241 RepID=UPI003D69A7C5
MDLPAVSQLCAEIPDVLRLLPLQDAPDQPVSAVHVSDLADPTPYLSGGELLLTTGLSLPRNEAGIEEYVARLCGAEVAALGLGLGPSLEGVPLALREVCARARLALLVVPPEGAFLDVTKAYWKLRTEAERRDLGEAVMAHSELVKAAFSGDPVSATLRSLAYAMRGWAAMLGPTGEVEHVHPSGRLQDAVDVAAELRSSSRQASTAPLTLERAEGSSIGYPITLGQRVVGHLLIGTENRLTGTQHRVGLAAAALLTLGTLRRDQDQARSQGHAQAVAMLVDMRLPDAAARLASRLDIAIAHEMRIVVVESTAPVAVDQVVREWCPGVVAGWHDPDALWFLAPSEKPDAARLGTALRQVDPNVVSLVSEAVPLDRVHDVRVGLQRLLDGLARGSTRVLEKRSLRTSGLDHALRRLGDYGRADLTGAVAAYLRNWGQWEPASRELGVHRNTLRHRIARAHSVLGLDLNDPDVAAELWLLLRRDGLA